MVKIGIFLYLYERYIDDGNFAIKSIPRKLKFDEKSDTLIEDEENDLTTENDEYSLNIVRAIADSCIPMLKWTSDTISQNTTRYLPVLDLELFVFEKEGRQQIGHKYYSKPMSNKQLISMSSAMPIKMKINILIEEGLRRIRNTSPYLFERIKLQLG